MMEIVASLPTSMNGASGGTKKHVEEWSRLDRLTGMLEHARVEADHWASTTSNSRHHFGKVVDSRARNLADGSVQQKQQTKQLEVFQAHIPGGSVQVIRSHTSTTSSWHNSKVLQSHSTGWLSNSSSNLLNNPINKMEAQIDELKFSHNPMNLNPEKDKANVARFLNNRRPPTRSRISKRMDLDDEFTFDKPSITYDKGEENKNEINIPISKIDDSFEVNGFAENHLTNGVLEQSGHEKLEKKKSISDENLSSSLYSEAGKIDEKENSDPWIRTKIRRSFQHPPRCKKKEENEPEKITSGKCELEHVLQKVLRRKGDFESLVKPSVAPEPQKPFPSWRRKSFVTEETLKETKQKLRHLSIDKRYVKNDKEDIDDGICTESKGNSDKEDEKTDANGEFINTSVAENQLTGSLESRNINKSDDWFDRRKSYGFEPVHAQQRNIAASLNSTPKTNLSTDSGICRSSELELVSTPIIKKLTEASEDRARTIVEEVSKFHEPIVKKDVSELLQKFERNDKPRTGSTVVTLMEEPKIKILDSFESKKEHFKTGKVLEAIRSFEKNTCNGDIFEPSSSTKTNAHFLEQMAEKPKSSLLSTDQDILSKRHSIACDDTKYMASTFTKPEVKLSEKNPSTSKTTIINVNNFETADASLPIVDNDAKKPKKVEFSKTEVHFAAAEPGKIKIVETDEKPPPANLYRRKKRSVSASPKVNLPQTKFGDYEKSLLNDKCQEKANDGVSKNGSTKTKADNVNDYNSQYTSTTSDNGLAVTICSMKPTDYRRASWSVVENALFPQAENKTGYSTKINFDGGGATVVAGAKSQQYEKARKSFTDLSEIKDKDCNLDASHNSENIQEKLIVRIGNSSGCSTMEKYVQKPTFTNSFRNSINTSKSNDFVKLSKKNDDNLKSTSLIIDTIKKSMNLKHSIANTQDNNEEKIDSIKSERVRSAIEQPSTYLAEMNKLQQKYRVKETASLLSEVSQNEKFKNRIYNTIPTTKNGLSRAKLLSNDLPSVLSAFDKLCRKIDKVMDENTNGKIHSVQRNTKTLKTLFVDSKSMEKHSSQSGFLYDNAGRDDGNVSDDSLKADEEVRSYMSTAIMEEYENELCGSWSRKRYFKHIKPVKVVKQDEFLNKSHFKPVKMNEDNVKIISNVTDVKKPTITSMPLKLNEDSNLIKNSPKSPKKSTTVLLNDCSKPQTNISNEKISNELDDDTNMEYYNIQKTSPVKMSSFINGIKKNNELKHTNNSSRISTEEMFKNESDPVKVIYHNIKIMDKSPSSKVERGLHAPKKECDKDAVKISKKINIRESVNNDNIRKRSNSVHDSFRKRSSSVHSKERLFNTGRDGWLNLPKERKSTSEKKIVENGKFKDIARLSQSLRDKRIESGLNGCGDISSEEDLTRRSKKLYKPMSTIDEKSNALRVLPKTEKLTPVVVKSKVPATRTTSNSSIESRSNSFEFRNPVLKTEERSKRRAARMLQNTSSREMYANWNAASSSDDVTSENEAHYSRSSKSRNIRKAKTSPKTVKPTTNSNMPNSTRIVTQSAAKMQINIFNMKEKPNETRKDNRSYYSSLKSSTSVDAAGLMKNKPQSYHREVSANSSQKSRTSKSTSSSNREVKKMANTSAKSSRLVR